MQVVAGNHDRWLLSDRLRALPDAHQRAEVADHALEFLGGLPATVTLPTIIGDVMLCHGVATNDLRKVWPGTARMGPERSRELDSIIASGATRLVLNGHMHYRVIVNFECLTLINAGTLKQVHRPGVSILDLLDDTVTAYEYDVGGALVPAREQHIHHDRTHHDCTHPDRTRRVWRDTQCFDGNWQPVTLYAE